MSERVHHRLCDWNIEQRPECCICGIDRTVPWFKAYVRGVLGQAVHLRNALIPNLADDHVEEHGQAALASSITDDVKCGEEQPDGAEGEATALVSDREQALANSLAR